MAFQGRFGNKPYVPTVAPASSNPEFQILTPGKSEKRYFDPLFPGDQKVKASGAQPQAKQTAATPNNLMDTGPDDSDQPSGVGRQAIAEGYGYEQGTGNIGGLGMLLGAATGIPFIGNKIADAMPEGNYGQYGTYDSQGNVFGNEGRAYDVVTGRPVNSYRNSGDWKNAAFSGYGQLRDAGENPISAALGSYDNSIYAYGATQDPATHAAARANRLRGEGAPITTTAGRINENTFGSDESGFDPITGAQLGFDNTRAFSAQQASDNTGVWGGGHGDLAATEFGPGVLQENTDGSGQRGIEHAGGTVVALTDTSRGPGHNVSLLATSDEGRAAADAELARRAGRDPAVVTPPPPAPEPERDNNPPPRTQHQINAVGSMDAARGYSHGPAPEPERESDSGGGGGGGK
ncbi:MAG: hypothetical protein OXU61_01455 [Gammaproteobacteria bacterium]|nr:hypothetical protein [Gammaproteobacteria bacterium]